VLVAGQANSQAFKQDSALDDIELNFQPESLTTWAKMAFSQPGHGTIVSQSWRLNYRATALLKWGNS